MIYKNSPTNSVNSPTVLEPPCLKPGSTLGLVDSSLPLLSSWKENYEIGKQARRSYGFQIKEGRIIRLKWWFAGTPTNFFFPSVFPVPKPSPRSPQRPVMQIVNLLTTIAIYSKESL